MNNWTRRAALLAGVTTFALGSPAPSARPFHGGAASGGGGGGGAVDIVTWTITEQSGSNQTNVPIDIGLPLGAGVFASTSAIQVLDSDGVTVIPCQEDNYGLDLSANRRIMGLSAVLPTLLANEKRQLKIQYLPLTSPTTGTNVTPSNVTATGYDCVHSVVFNDGNTYTASAAAAIAAGTWTNKTTAANKGKWRGRQSSAGLVDEWICYAPLMNGGTPCPGNLNAVFSISAWKTGRAAVSGGNPVIAIATETWIEDAFIQQTSPIDKWYDWTITSGSNTIAYVGSSPAQTLTLGATSGGQVAASVPSAAFTQNSVGMLISDGTGYGVISAYTDTTHITLSIFKTMSSTSISSGVWRIWGINHPNGARMGRQEIWYSGLAVTTKPNLDSSLGVPWNTGTLTGGPFPYIAGTGLLLNYSTPASSISNSTSLGVINSQGTNPSGWLQRGFDQQCGNILMYMAGTGAGDDRAVTPGFYVRPLIRFDSSAKACIFGSANKAPLTTIHYRDANTGNVGTFNNGTDWSLSYSGSGATKVPTVSANSINQWTMEEAHHPGVAYVPYILTGKFFYMEEMQHWTWWLWSKNLPSSLGSQINRLMCVNAIQMRASAWALRTASECALSAPDDNPACLGGLNKSQLKTWLANHQTATNSGTANALPLPGSNIQYVNNTGVGKDFTTPGPRYLYAKSNVLIFSLYELYYFIFAGFHAKKMGMASSDFLSFLSWAIQGVTSVFTDTAELVPNYVYPSYKTMVNYNGAWLRTWTDVYRASAISPLNDYGGNRYLGATVTLSGLGGSALTVTMPAGYFTGGTTFYQDGYVIAQDACSHQTTTFTGSISGGTLTVTAVAAPFYFGGQVIISGAGVAANTIVNQQFNGPAGGPGQYGVTISQTVPSTTMNTLPTITNGGSSYAVNDTIDLTILSASSNSTVTTRTQLKVTTVSGGVITGVSVNDPGCYVANSRETMGGTGTTATQFSTSGSGTGATFANIELNFGCAAIVSVADPVVTLDTTGGHGLLGPITRACCPFARTTIANGLARLPNPAPGDNNGSNPGLTPFVPVPYTQGNEISALAKMNIVMAAADGYTDAATSLSYLNTNYTGSVADRWLVSYP